VVSGTAKAVAVVTGRGTAFGKVSERLALRSPETNFERGVGWFGYFFMEVTLLLVVAVFAFNVYLARSVLESFLFALALAVGSLALATEVVHFLPALKKKTAAGLRTTRRRLYGQVH